jgi:hypothetical protein
LADDARLQRVLSPIIGPSTMSRTATSRSELQLGLDALNASADRTERQRLIEKLIPIAHELAQRAGKSGITVANLRHYAARNGLLPRRGKEQRDLSFLGTVMRKAKLINTLQRRRSDVVGSHGNLHVVYVAPGFTYDHRHQAH